MQSPLVGILMGSDSDLSVMKKAAEILDEFGVSYKLSAISAHRTPDLLHDFVEKIVSDGARVIIAGAGGAAHLPGVIAAKVSVPVIGVPIKSAALSGMDSLLSIVQMPSGVPVATVAIDGAKNAGLLAVQILATGDGELREKYSEYKKKLGETVAKKAKKLEEEGFKRYLNG